MVVAHDRCSDLEMMQIAYVSRKDVVGYYNVLRKYNFTNLRQHAILCRSERWNNKETFATKTGLDRAT